MGGVARRGAVVAAALALGMVAPPAHALDDFDYRAVPALGTAGTSLAVSSTTPCPTPDGGGEFAGVRVTVIDATGNRAVGTADFAATGDRNWSGSVTVSAEARNGDHFVLAQCRYGSGDSTTSIYLVPMRRFEVRSPAGRPDPALRVAGAHAIATAVAVSKDLHPDQGSATAVVLSRVDSYVDALAGAPLAHQLSAPLLLTQQGALDPLTAGELRRVLAPGGDVHLLGGTGALGAKVEAAVTALGFTVVRYAGANRYDTAVKVAAAVGRPGAVLFANGLDFREALVAGAAAPNSGGNGPGIVLLTNGRVLPPESRAYLSRINGNTPRFAVGALAAAAVPAATPLVGRDPSETSRKVADRFFVASHGVAIAPVGSFAEPLVGGVHAAANGMPLLLTPPGSLPATLSSYLQLRKNRVAIAFVYGGTAGVSESVRTAVARTIS